jgi:nucleoid-associated protein EbfC
MLAFASPLVGSTPLYSTRAPSVGGRRAACAGRRPSAPRTLVMMADEKKNPLGGLGGLGNIMDAMKKAQEFSSSAKNLQDELKDTEIEATVRDGAVKVVLTGQQHPVEVTVSDDLAKLGGEEVSKAVTECLVAAHTKVQCLPCFLLSLMRARAQTLPFAHISKRIHFLTLVRLFCRFLCFALSCSPPPLCLGIYLAFE